MVGSRLFGGLKVLELASQIAGPYCGKQFADAGADVVKVEPDGGDPLRTWSADLAASTGARGVLFSYLNAGKRSVGEERREELVAAADLLVVDETTSGDSIERWRAARPELTVVSLTPYGRTGPWADRPWNDFVLQAASGSIGVRGEPEREPLQAAGRLGEFISGAYAAVAAAAGVLGAAAHGSGEYVDVSMLECNAITMGGFGALQDSLGRTPHVPARFVEMPSIERAADGYVGFCTVTRQQFQDFAIMIGHPEYLADEELSTYTGRQRRRHEFQQAVYLWTAERPVEEIIEQAALFRIPVTRIGTPETIAGFDHLAERNVFLPAAGENHVRPRRPFLIDGVPAEPAGRAPAIRADTGTVTWTPRPAAVRPDRVTHSEPLSGLRVVDLTAFWAGPTASQLLAMLGADVIKVESIQRPDGMRFSSSRPPSEPNWWDFGAHYQTANTNKRGITLDLGSARGRELLYRLVAQADVLIENFSPRVLDNFGITWETVHKIAPGLVMVRMPAFGLTGPWRNRTGFAQTMEQATGLAWRTGYADGGPIIPKGVCDPNAGVHAAFATLAALAGRNASGRGSPVECPMVEAALSIAAEVVLEHSANGTRLGRAGNRDAGAAPQGVYAARGHEQWLALAVTTNAQWAGLRAAMGDPAWAGDPALADASGRRAAHDHLDERIGAWAAELDVERAAELLVAAGVPAAVVVEPRDALDNPQLQARGFAEWVEHRVTGRHRIMGMPFKLAAKKDGWITRPAPVLGQHNDEILGDVLGLSPQEIDELRAQGVIGDRPLGV